VEQIALQWDTGPRVFTVSEFTEALRGLLDREFGTVWVSGEISGTKVAASGHYYFTLKDKEAQLRAVCFKGTVRYLAFKPRDGVAVRARGRLDVYPGRGDYQLIVDRLEPVGDGALQAAFEQLKKKLALEGLFDAARKRPLPKLPMRIGLVTSPTGAVIQDMLNILSRRFPGLHIRLYPAQVQGEGSIEAVSRGLDYFSRTPWAQVVIVARGGGSLEDLWTFNEERVARAIAASTVPVVSAIGHETDFTIADFVADLRAPTPSAAAELVVQPRQQLLDQIAAARRKLLQAARYRIAQSARRLHEIGVDRATTVLHRAIGRRAQRVDELDHRSRERIRAAIEIRKRRLDALAARLRRQDVRLRYAQARHRLETAEKGLLQSIRWRLAKARSRLSPALANLAQLSPLRVLNRGYALVQTSEGRLVKSPADAPVGTGLRIRLAEGSLAAAVTRGPGPDAEGS
jgi:exodeoxyribonuclease VII large subunit